MPNLDTLHHLSHQLQFLVILAVPALALVVALACSGGLARDGSRPRGGWQRAALFSGGTLAGLAAVGLAAILADGFLSASLVSQGYRCSTNLRSLAQGIQMYAGDWDDTLPPSASWSEAAARGPAPLETERAFHCPAARSPFSYAYNAALDRRKQDRVKQPAETALLYEAAVSTRNAAGDGRSPPIAKRHSGTASILFSDGHLQQSNDQRLARVRWSP